jgi:hypothetical protein
MPASLLCDLVAVFYMCLPITVIRVVNFVVLRSRDQANGRTMCSSMRLGHKVRLVPGRNKHHAVKTYGWRQSSINS